jgi:hypothetical protein
MPTSDRRKPADISHTIIQDAVHKMRQFWSMRSNKWQHIAQTLRFEWHEKQGIIATTRGNRMHFPDVIRRLDAVSKAQKLPSDGKSCIQDFASTIAAKRNLPP